MEEAVQLRVVKRSGEVVAFDSVKIANAISKAVRASGSRLEEPLLSTLVEAVKEEIEQRFIDLYPNVENVQDIVEKHLVRSGLYEISKTYILYRESRRKDREQERVENQEKARLGKLRVKRPDGSTILFDLAKIKRNLQQAAQGFETEVSVDLVLKEFIKNIYDGITLDDIEKGLILSSIAFIERDPVYSSFSARLLFNKIFREVTGESPLLANAGDVYRNAFSYGIQKGVEDGYLDKRLLDFDLVKLGNRLTMDRDDLFQYMGLQTLYERYFARVGEKRIELPQAFWMRVAMGLAIDETEKEEKAIEFYEIMSTLRYVPSTPTLFHAGTRHPQLSSCYLTTVDDDLKHIFKCLGDNAQLSKWSGGIGTDYTNIRSTGAMIKSNGISSQGVIPFLKIANDVTVAINRSGKRRGATCAYLETWHLDIEDFLDLRKNTGDERRRTHDMNTSNWIPDLFMKRVINDEDWTLFSPDEASDLHHLYGRAFEKKYVEYEGLAREGKISKYRSVSSKKLWRKMLSMLFETGHPWITFKDPCNIRSPQDHAGVIHSSNLCTEITLNTSADETAVCNLGSINLAHHVANGVLHKELLADTVSIAMRMLDNVIDINFYPTIEAEQSNLKHRPVGLGIMGFQDALYLTGIDFDSPKAVSFSSESMEYISYHAILASSQLAKERGAYQSYAGSKWDRGIFPIDTIDLLEKERGMPVEVSREETLDWIEVRNFVKNHGMRNSNVMAIAPTATISTISGCFPCIEPIYKNMYVKANMSGEFTVVNPYLISDLKARGLWNTQMLEQLKYYDGNVGLIAGIPDALKRKYKEVFDIDSLHLIDVASERGKWIDQSQSFNVFLKGVSGKRLHDTYVYAWQKGMKTTYYLRSLAASQIEKSTLDASKYGFTQKREYAEQAASSETAPVKSVSATLVAPAPSSGQLSHSHSQDFELPTSTTTDVSGKVCSLMDPDCEACQ